MLSSVGHCTVWSCIAELLCSVKSAHIVPADERQMFYSWRKDSVHSLKHIPGFMKRVKDGGRRSERNEDWLNPPFQPFLPSDEEVILTLCWCLSLLSKQTHPQQITSWSASRNTSPTVHALHTGTITSRHSHGESFNYKANRILSKEFKGQRNSALIICLQPSEGGW